MRASAENRIIIVLLCASPNFAVGFLGDSKSERWLVGSAVALLALISLGHLSRPLANLCVFASLGVGAVAIAWVILLCVNLFRKKWWCLARTPFVFALLFFSEYQSVRIVFGCPWFVTQGVAAIEQEAKRVKESTGKYPGPMSRELFQSTLGDLLREHGCAYSPQGEFFNVTCRAAVFTRCTYDSQAGEMRSWD